VSRYRGELIPTEAASSRGSRVRQVVFGRKPPWRRLRQPDKMSDELYVCRSAMMFSEAAASGSSSDSSLRSFLTGLRAAAMPRHLGVSSQLLVAEPAGDMQIVQMHVAWSRNAPSSAAQPCLRLSHAPGKLLWRDSWSARLHVRSRSWTCGLSGQSTGYEYVVPPSVP
jgi:hypothetical protein